MAEEQHTRPRRNRITDEIQHRRRVRHRLRQRDSLHYNPIPLCAQIPRVLASRMLLVGHQHFIARLHVQAVGDVTVRLRRVAHQRQFVARAAHELRQRIAKLIPRPVTPDRIIFRIALCHFFRIVIAVENCSQHRHRTGSHRPVVQINLVAGNQELFAPFGPIRLFVRTVKRAVWQLRRFLLEERVPFCRQAERTGCPGNACERRQKSTPIHHECLHKASCADSTLAARPSQPAFLPRRLASARHYFPGRFISELRDSPQRALRSIPAHLYFSPPALSFLHVSTVPLNLYVWGGK